MMNDNILQQMAISLEPGEEVAHVICLVLTTRMDTFEDELQIVSTPQTNRITTMGALTEALEMAKMPYTDYGDDDE